MKNRVRKYADGGAVNVAAPPVGMTDLSANAAPMQAQQASPYVGYSDSGMMDSGSVGTGITQPTGSLTAKNRMTGAVGIAPDAQPFAKGGLVKKPRKKMAKGGMMCSPRKRMAMGMKRGGK